MRPRPERVDGPQRRRGARLCVRSDPLPNPQGSQTSSSGERALRSSRGVDARLCAQSVRVRRAVRSFGPNDGSSADEGARSRRDLRAGVRARRALCSRQWKLAVVAAQKILDSGVGLENVRRGRFVSKFWIKHFFAAIV